MTTPADAGLPPVFSSGMGHQEAGEIPGSTSESTDHNPLAVADGSAISGTEREGQDQVQAPDNGMEHFERLQRRLMFATACAVAAAVPITGLLFDGSTALSLLLGGLAGLLYLRLLARSVSRLGGDRRSVGKFQLVVPVVLILAAARIPGLEILPALLGFLLYKPALILQALLDR